ncbi:hypothetical protein [Sphingosinithalassobacter sp. CS137]|uniref:hypothetical protein n=1 Tax=Sphingosinithalassobacter sp. CS137 TaxID=2762748 RepID=UPI00165E6B82|nr:hypothetical protein [Sphingosinithalassobacter sp. CS137]
MPRRASDPPPPLAPGCVAPAGRDDPHPAVRAWIALRDAGRIGAPASAAPDAARIRARTEALLRPRRRGGVW